MGPRRLESMVTQRHTLWHWISSQEKKYEDLCPTSHNLSVPFVKKTEYQVISVEGDQVSLLEEDGSTKDDLNLPTGCDDDEKTRKEMADALEAGKTLFVIVQKAMGMEKIIGTKVTD